MIIHITYTISLLSTALLCGRDGHLTALFGTASPGSEMGGYPGAVYGPTPWSHRVLGTKGEVRVVSSDVVLYNDEHPEGRTFEHADEKISHGLLLEDFANAVLRGTFNRGP